MSYNWEYEYLDLLGYVQGAGENRADRTGTGTKAIFGTSLNIDFADGFPLITTKKMPWKSIVSELLWFIEGSGDERRLAEILHGTRDESKSTIWTANANAPYWKGGKFPGDLGRVYGVQWRNWESTEVLGYEDYLIHHGDKTNTTSYFGAKVQTARVDQLAQLIEGLKNDPTGRRHVLTAWNPGELHRMGLPPCHMFVQFYLSNDRKLSCQMYQRSVDSFLGLPFNIASYALLLHIIAKCIDATPGTLHMLLGDTHIYNNHTDAVLEQLSRDPTDVPTLTINTDNTDIDGFKMEDFVISGYNPLPAIKADMAV